MSDDDEPTLAGDELAGIVGIFGGLTREELRQACRELVYRETGDSPDDERIDEWIAAAVEDGRLVETAAPGEPLLIPGPTAFSQLPPGAEDLPHLIDAPDRTVDRSTVATDLLGDIGAEIDAGVDDDRAHQLIDLTYDIESWADVDASELRDRLDG